MCTGRAGTGLLWEVTCDDRPVQMTGQGWGNVWDWPPICISSLLLLCVALMINWFLCYVKLAPDHPALSFISQWRWASWNSFSRQVSHFDFSLPFLVLGFPSPFSIFRHCTLRLLSFMLHDNICCLLKTYCVPAALSTESLVLTAPA